MHLRKQTFIFGLNNAFSKRLCISKRTMHEASTDFAESRCIDVSFSFKQDGDESEHVVTNMNIDIHQGLPERYILMTGWEGRGIRGPRGNRGRVPPPPTSGVHRASRRAALRSLICVCGPQGHGKSTFLQLIGQVLVLMLASI